MTGSVVGKKNRWLIASALVPAVFMLAGITIVQAIDVSISATVAGEPPIEPDTKVRFIGKAYPTADLTFRQNGGVLATTQASPTADFDVEIIINPGVYTFTIFGEDAQGVVGRTFTISLTLSVGVTTTVSGIFLGPTIGTDFALIQVDDTITVLGTSVPNSTVNITVNSHATVTDPVTADGSGLYSKQYVGGAGVLDVGSHTARARSVAPDASISENSNTVSFSVEDQSQCAGKVDGDINCDGFVNLTDFSIFLFYWNQTNPAEPRADINNDGTVNVIDFSIMLFNWTG